ncbi:MAG TPA: carboxylating nicotinate-nucleotide diphosphorylase [Firmicutes bacterium]|nr:carboxylating nicotinate-nucleotide diphosphorylase [Bacillota bacterium]HJD23428.1 carboxylating nicotinate-nucleotide diphosphorylase [Bacillota bacterium]
MLLPQFAVDDVIKTALNEDINYIDTTTDLMIPEDSRSAARFLAKAEGVLCGMDVALRVFALLDPTFRAAVYKKDGDRVRPGDVIAEVEGATRSLLKGERTALNLLQHLSGVATATDRCVQIVRGTRASIADTRKTLPGLRFLQKYAVTVGGGRNHRFNLSDGAMLKDNHIDAAGGITAAVRAIRGRLGHMVKLEVETRSLDEVREALAAGADVIMLDNMDCAAMAEAVRLADGRVPLEASGGITAETLRAVAETGVDIISIGALTHSVKALDISLKIQKA